MIGAVVGFFTGILIIILITFNLSVNSLVNAQGGDTSLHSMELRLLIVIACTAAGFISGLRSGQIFPEKISDVSGPEAHYAIGQGADKKHSECDDDARACK